jgi:hypothetical protein
MEWSTDLFRLNSFEFLVMSFELSCSLRSRALYLPSAREGVAKVVGWDSVPPLKDEM